MAPQGVIYNERYLSIGDETLIGPNVCLTAGISGEQEMLSLAGRDHRAQVHHRTRVAHHRSLVHRAG